MDRKNQDREKTSTSSHTSQNNDRSSSKIYNMNRNHNNYKIYNDNNYPPSKKFKWNNSYGRRYNNNQNWYGKKCIKPGDENNTTSYYNKHKNNHYHRYNYRHFNRQENDHHNSGPHKNFTSTSTQLLNQEKYEHRNFDRQSNEHNNNSRSDDCSSFANYYAESNQNIFYNDQVSDSYVLNFNKKFDDQTQRQIQNSNPFYDSYFKYIEPDQTAVEENIITKQNDQENANDQYRSPLKISLVPLSFLLNEKFQSDSEFIKNQQQTNTTTTIAVEASSTANVITATTAQTVQDPEKIKKRLLNRLVKMDKMDIKNVINNPTTKFDTVLKIHARKKLREEIRKQLKNMNIVNTARSIGEKTNENDLSIVDESVDCGQIPDAILNEISKSLNIELLTEAGLHEDENYLSEIDATTLLSAEDLMAATTMTTTKATTAIPTTSTALTTTTARTMTTSTISVPSTLSGPLSQIISQQENSKDELIDVNPAQSSSTYSPLQHSLLQTKLSKSTSDKIPKKSSPKKSSPKKITSKDEIKNTQKHTKSNKIATVNRSSSNSSSDSIDSSSSDSESNSISNNSGDSSSSTSSDNRNNDNCKGSESSTIKTVKKKKMLESNVITHFNTLILPIMQIREQNKLEKRKFRNNTENLLFILEYCFKETANSAIVVTDYRKRILRKQIKSKNNEKVLEFLIEKIKEIFELNKSKKKTSSSKVQNENNSNICEKTKDSNNKQKANKPKKQHSNEKRSDSTSNTTSTGTNSSNCVGIVSDSFTKMPTKGKTPQKSQLQKESSLNNESLSRNSISTSTNDGNSRINTRNALQLKSNPIKTSKSNDKHIQDNNSNLSKETFIDEHKEINNCTESMPPSVQVKIDLSAISATGIAGSVNAGSDINNTCVGNTDGKNQKKSDGIIQLSLLSSTDKGDSEGKTEVGSNEKTASNPEIWCNKNKRNVVATTDGLKENSKQNDNKASENDLNEILNEENNLNSNIRQNEIISLIGENDDKNHLTPESLKHNKIQRSWKSPGEKKCIQIPKENSAYNRNCSNHNDNDNFQSRNEIHNRNDIILNDLNLNYNNLLTTSELYNSTESLRLLSLIQQNKLSDAVLNNLKEIDVKLIELHKRKMFIEEMILKMQKDKMALERDSMQLQQEKFIIINTALSNTNISSYVNSNYQLQTNFDIKTESSPMKINLCSDDSDVGSTVDNDTIGWSNATDVMTNLLSMSSSSSQLNQRKRKLILKEKLDSKKCCKSLNFSNMTNDNVKFTQSSDNLLTSRGSQNENRSLTEKNKVKNTLLSKNSTVEVITSGTKIVHSNGNCSSKKKCSSKNLNLNISESISVEKNSNNDEFSENTEEDEVEEDIEQVEQIEDNAISDGSFENLKFPITHIEVANDFLIAASEDGNIYKFDLRTKKLISKYSKHTETVTGIRVYSCNNFVYSISLDGYLKKTCLENFGLELQSTNLQEPLQCFDLHWDIAFIGSRWGNIFTYKIKTNKLSEILLCSVGSSITALKATKEGARKILIISSKGNEINFRDATSGLLLRTIEIPENLNIYSILLDGDLLYCGSNKNEIHLFNFTTGTKTDIFKCGNVAFSMKLYKGKLLFIGCYDGFVYVLDKVTGSQIGRFPGAGKMILALHIVGEKFITSSKDNIMDIRSIPKYIPALLK